MATIRQNNIDFTNVSNEPIFMTFSKTSISDNNDGTGKFDTDMAGDEIGKSFNAIEIDWNGATTYMVGENRYLSSLELVK